MRSVLCKLDQASLGLDLQLLVQLTRAIESKSTPLRSRQNCPSLDTLSVATYRQRSCNHAQSQADDLIMAQSRLCLTPRQTFGILTRLSLFSSSSLRTEVTRYETLQAKLCWTPLVCRTASRADSPDTGRGVSRSVDGKSTTRDY
jgi:hypothetical protein